MLTIATGGTVQGVAASASTVTYTVLGDAKTTSDAYQVLAQGQLPSTAGVLYTVPAATTALVNQISLRNTGGTAQAVTVYVNGTGGTNQLWSGVIPANGSADYTSSGWRVYDSSGFQQYVGATGPAGSTGPAGTAGNTILNGTVNPTAGVGNNGDFYLNTTTEVLWGPKSGGAWPGSGTSLIGPTGPTGPAGPIASIGNVGSTPNAKALTLTGSILNAELASASFPGLVTAAQFTILSDTSGTNTGDQLVFSQVTGNSGTANADTTADSIAITGTGNIVTAAADSPDGLTIATTAAATSKISSHYYAFGDFGIVGDWQITFTGSCSTGTPGVITDSSNPFVAADIGKQITLTGAGASGAKYVGTISSLNSAGSVNVSPNISTTASNQGLQWGTNNNTAWTNAQTAVNALAYPAVIIEFEHTPINRYGQAVTCTWNKPVILQGQGRAYNADTGNYAQVGGTALVWVGATSDGGTLFKGMHTWVPTGAFNIKGGGWRDIWFDCRNGDQAQALYATKMSSVNGFSIRESFVIDALAYGMWLDIDSTPTEQESTARGMACNLGFRMLDGAGMTTPITTSSAVTLTSSGQSLSVAANTLPTAGYGWIMSSAGRPVLFNWTGGGGTTTLTGATVSAEDAIWAPTTVSGSNIVQAVPGNGCAVLLSGNTTANTNLNDMRMWQISHGTTWGPAAVEFANADSNVLAQIVVNGGNATNDGAINRIRKPGVRFNGHTANLGMAARNNVFYDGDSGVGGVDAMALLNTAAKMTAPSGPNYWWGLQFGNGAPIPTIETGAYFDWSANGGVTLGMRNADVGAATAYVAGTAKQIPGSVMLLPPQAFQLGTTFRWRHQISKTAAGAAARLHHIRIGTTGTVSDAIVSTVTITGTAVADSGWVEIISAVTNVGASATVSTALTLTHNFAATGLQNASGITANGSTPTTFNSASSGLLYISLSLTAGTSEVPSTAFCTAEIVRVGNQAA